MSTPPPPLPASGPVIEPPQQPALSEPARLVNTFIAPNKTFADVKRKPSWFIPWLVTGLLSLMVAGIAVQKLDMEQLVRQSIERSPMAQRRMEGLSPEQRERGIALQTTITRVSFFLSPVFFLILGLLVAAILMAVFNFGFGAEVSFPSSLAVTFYSFLPGIVGAVLLVVSLLVSSDPNSIDFASGNPVATNPAFFMDWASSSRFLYSLASGVDVLRIWEIVLLGLGFSVVSSSPKRKLSAGTAITTVFVLYAVYVLGRAALAAAF